MEPFLGQIIMFGGNFAPKGWALCNGQLLPINQNSALFAILGTTYGGDGRTTFGLPDLRGRSPLHAGDGLGFHYKLGQKGGESTHVLRLNELPAHDHTFAFSGNNPKLHLGTGAGDTDTGQSNSLAINTTGNTIYTDQAPNNILALNDDTISMAGVNGKIGDTGGNQPHNNMHPYQVVNFIIATYGSFPSRN